MNSSPFHSYHFIPKGPSLLPQIALTSPQMALILALERVCQSAGFWLVCDRCARERKTYSHLVANNGIEDPVWKIDCPCTERRFTRASLEHTMVASGDLLKLAETLLLGTGLAVRCPSKRSGCLWTPLSVNLETDGTLVRCQCWQTELGAGRYRFTKKMPVQ